METSSLTWDETTDVVVVGTGAAGLTAAIRAADAGARVLVVEKMPVVGGSTSVSAGLVWVPLNHHQAEAGVEDSRDDALAYVRRLSGRVSDPELLELCVDRGAEMLAYLEARTPLRMTAMERFADYYAAYDVEGKKTGGRSCEPCPFPVGEQLPEWAARIQTKVAVRGQAARNMLAEDLGQLPRTPEELARREREDVRTKGSALVAALLRGVLDRGIEVCVQTRAEELIGSEGAVHGIRCTGPDGAVRAIETRHGVVLASGGFEWNRELVSAFIGYDLAPISPQHATGDGLVMGMAAGALLGNMHSYWGSGAMIDPSDTSAGAPLPTFDEARAAGGTIIINAGGERFVNEAAPYHDFAKAFGEFDPSAAAFRNEVAWMVFDEGLRSRKAILSLHPGEPVPDWVATADTIGELARQLGIQPARLEATVAEFNHHAAHGEDPRFGRPRGMAGSKIRPVDQAPYYAVRIYAGTLGTSGGLRTDARGRVRRARGGVVEGLYAAGNVAASPLGWGYPGGGATLWAAMTMAYLAGDQAGCTPLTPDEEGRVIGPTSSGWALARLVSSVPSAVDAGTIRERIAAYYASFSPADARARENLFAPDCHVEDPAGHVVATDRDSLGIFFDQGIPPHWSIRFRLDRTAVVGQEALATSTLTLRVGDREPVEVIVNAHFVFADSGLIRSLRMFFDEAAMTDVHPGLRAAALRRLAAPEATA
jgi:succinate dehydrogenase/fumarate reductase flavoprotein subunit